MARRSLAAAIIFLLTFPSTGAVFSQTHGKAKIGATLAVTETGSWKALQKGLEFRKIRMQRSESGHEIEFKLLRMDSRIIVPQVLAAGSFQLKWANAKTFAEKAGAIAAINASYFDEKGRPLAYLKISEKEINRSVSKHRLYTGIFGVGESGPFVTHRDEFQPLQAGTALQCGPLLLHQGAPLEIVAGLGRFARRSVIGTDKQARVLVGVTDAVGGGLSFAELQELFIKPRWQLDAVELLNLDGGGSAQLYIKAGKFEEEVAGTSEVPVAIGFFAKPN